jgi:hypothetical protein
MCCWSVGAAASALAIHRKNGEVASPEAVAGPGAPWDVGRGKQIDKKSSYLLLITYFIRFFIFYFFIAF